MLDVRIGAETAKPVAALLRERGVPFAFYTGQVDFEALRRDWPGAPVIAKPAPTRQLRQCHAMGLVAVNPAG